jgi:rubrerythrin
MDIGQAIKTAIDYEKKVTDVYKDAVKNIGDPIGRKVAQVLADEEKNHVDYLLHCRNQWEKTGTITAVSLETAIPSAEAIQRSIEKLKSRMGGGKRVDEAELSILRKALHVETETSAFYRKMVQEMPVEAQPLFSRFLEIEEGHLAIVQAEIDTLTGAGFWFDFREIDLEAGG